MNLRAFRDFMVAELSIYYDRQEARSMAENLFYYLAGIRKTDFVTDSGRVLREEEYYGLMAALEELKREKPLQYVTGRGEFMGLTLVVDENVLVPRPETEELVQWALEDLKALHVPVVLDVGTGSGCIALAVKKYVPDSEVHGMEISPGALSVARRNSRLLHLDVDFFHGDVFDKEMLSDSAKYDVILSNPPYVTESERSHIRKNVKDHEPAGALFVPDHDPLVYYRALSELALRKLERGGALYVEINERFGHLCMSLFLEAGFEDVILRKDMSGRDRMVRAKRGATGRQ